MKKTLLIAVVVILLGAGGWMAYEKWFHMIDPVHLGGQTDPKRLGAFDGKVDTGRYGKLLAKYVNDKGEVDYGAWKKNKSDLAALEKEINSYANVDMAKFDRKQKLAFLINAYNAITLKGILDHYPTFRGKPLKSIGDIKGFWDRILTNIGGKPVSLNDIEHKILRKMGEPRIHFTIVCASIGCPHLKPWAYRPEKLDEQLDRASRGFFADPAKNRLDKDAKTLYLSQLFNWFGEDFAKNKTDREKILFAASQMAPEDAQYLKENVGDIEVKYLDYDWNLNIVRR